MVVDAVRNYLQLATGLTEVTVSKARQAATGLIAQADSVRGSMTPDAARKAVTELTDELLSTSRNNRDLLLAIVRSEAERVVDRVGVATRDEIEALDARIRRLDERLDTLAGSTAAPASKPARKKPAPKPAASPAADVPAADATAADAPAEGADTAAGAEA